MRDIYLYQNSSVLRNKLNLRNQNDLEDAEADYCSMRLRELAQKPLPGEYDIEHFLSMHWYIFQDLYEWAGEPRKINIEKPEPALGGLSVEYSDVFDIRRDLYRSTDCMRNRDWKSMSLDKLTQYFSRDLAAIWKIHAFREGNTRTTITFCCQFADEHGFSVDRTLFEENSYYVRTALVAYNAVFHDLGDRSQKQHLERIIRDSIHAR